MTPSRQRGVLLIAMIFLLIVMATIGMLLNRENVTAMQSRGTNFNIFMSRYVAEAGLRHVEWELNGSNCANYKNLPTTNFITVPGDPSKNWSYSANVSATGGSPVDITVTALGPDGAKNVLVKQGVTVYRTKTILSSDGSGGDTYIDGKTSNGNFGGSDQIQIVQDKKNKKPKVGLLRFDLSSIPAGTQVKSARMVLFLVASTTTSSVAVHKITTDWAAGNSQGGSYTIGGATWNEAKPGKLWTQPGGDYDAAVTDTRSIGPLQIIGGDTLLQKNFYAWDVTSLAANWVNLPGTNFGVLLDPVDDTKLAIFASAEDPNMKKKPKILLEIPCP